MSQKDIILNNNDLNLDSENKKIYINTIERAIASNGEEECETWRTVQSPCCGNWLKQLEEGAESLETIMPLTAERIPFHIRYTAEFDENGHPYKAYGSATPAINLDVNQALQESSCKLSDQA